MERSPDQPPVPPRDAPFWAQRVEHLKVTNVPEGALNMNVDGRRIVGPLQGFGKMWQKTYRMRLSGTIAPADVIATWKEHFPKFWPQGNRFYGPLTGIAPGEVALLNLSMPGGMRLSTGVLVLYADDESFTLMTPQGHMFGGWITFSSYEDGGDTVVQAQVLMRASDPIYEIGLVLGGHHAEDTFWTQTLQSLADHLDATGQVETQVVCVDRRLQWRQARNIWHNAAIRTALYSVTAPLRWARKHV